MAPTERLELVLELQLPHGEVEQLLVDAAASGVGVLMRMLPLKRKYRLPEDMRLLRPDGAELELGTPLQAQGLVDGSLLTVATKDAAVRRAPQAATPPPVKTPCATSASLATAPQAAAPRTATTPASPSPASAPESAARRAAEAKTPCPASAPPSPAAPEAATCRATEAATRRAPESKTQCDASASPSPAPQAVPEAAASRATEAPAPPVKSPAVPQAADGGALKASSSAPPAAGRPVGDQLGDAEGMAGRSAVDRAEALRSQGEAALREGRCRDAAARFTDSLLALARGGPSPPGEESEDDEVASRRGVEAAALAGRARARLGLSEHRLAREDAEASLAAAPGAVDAALALAAALRGLGDLDGARARLGWLLLQHPGHREVRAALAAVELARRARPGAPRGLGAFFRRCLTSAPEEAQAVVLSSGSTAAAASAGEVLAGEARALRSAVLVLPSRSAPAVQRCRRLLGPSARVVLADDEAALPCEAFEAPSRLRLLLPGGAREEMVVDVGRDTGAAVLAKLAMWKRSGKLNGDAVLQVLSPSGDELRADRRLAEQGVQAGSALRVTSAGAVVDEEPVELLTPAAEEALAQPVPTKLLILCDRLVENLVGDGLVEATLAAFRAAERFLPAGSVATAAGPSIATLIFAPLARPTEDSRRLASDDVGDALGDHPWVAVDLDKADSRYRLAAAPRPLLTIDFNDRAALERRLATEDHSEAIEAEAAAGCAVAAVAVWWRLEGLGGARLSSEPSAANAKAEGWPERRQAVYPLPREECVALGETMRFRADFLDQLSALRFELLTPTAARRESIVEVFVDAPQVVWELREALDATTRRLQRPVEVDWFGAEEGLLLAEGDRLLQVDGFEEWPAMSELWDALEGTVLALPGCERGVRLIFASSIHTAAPTT